MRIEVKVALLDSQGERFMGAGPMWLLEGIRQTGSIRQAALAMEMSYAKAHRLLGRLEQALGVRLLSRRIGGAEHGGAGLTPEGVEFLERYTRLCQALQARARDEEEAFGAFCRELASRRVLLAAVGSEGEARA